MRALFVMAWLLFLPVVFIAGAGIALLIAKSNRFGQDTLCLNTLKKFESSLELVMHGSGVGLWSWDIKSGKFEISPGCLDYLQQPELGSISDIERFRSLLHKEDAALWTEKGARRHTREGAFDGQFRLRNADGTWNWIHAIGRINSPDENDKPTSYSGLFIDINVRKQAELRATGLAQIIEESLNEVYIIDAESFRFIEVNRGARENLGFSLEELRNMTPPDIVPSYGPGRLEEVIAPLLSGRVTSIQYESKHQRKDGTTYPVLLNLQLAQLSDKKVFIAFILDLTKRHELERQLRQAHRLESVGQLAAGVAHEINTPMQFISNNIHYLSDCFTSMTRVIAEYEAALSDSKKLSWEQRLENFQQLYKELDFDTIQQELPEAVKDSQEGVDRVLGIVRAMREFTHMGERGMKPTDLNHAITNTLTMTKSQWKGIAEVQYDLDPSLPYVDCDPGAMNQVLLNLVVNASDAVADRFAEEGSLGKIKISTSYDEQFARIHVEDNGCGMDDWTLERIYDPFFTTKEAGRGTGQGLSFCHRIITQQHQGVIDACSKMGKGTVFKIKLPIRHEYANSETPAEMTLASSR